MRKQGHSLSPAGVRGVWQRHDLGTPKLPFAEPGVLVLYAVSEKDNPTHIRVFEVYASTEAYRAHLEAPQFKKYKAVTENMVKSLKLVQTTPVALAAKAR